MTAMSMNFIVSFIVVHTLTITLLMVSLITLSYTLYCLSLPRPLPGIPYNELAARRFLGDLPEIRKAVSYREWIWNQPRKHGSVVAQVFLRPFRGPTVIVTDLDAAVEIFDRRRKDFDRGSRNKEVVGLVAPNFHFTMNSSDPSFSAHRELIKDVMTVEFLNEVTTPRVYNKVSLLVQLWSLKIVRGEGRPFVAFEDLHLFALDTICAIAFGLNDHNILQQEIKCVEDNGFVVSHTSTDPINFLHAPRSSQVEALLDMSPMMSIAQKSPMPGLSQLCALLDPFHARACRYRRDILRAKTMKILPPSHNADTNKASVSTQNALDQMQIREHHIATKLGRLPNIYSAAIRDELLGFIFAGHETTAAVLSWWVKYMAAHQRVQDSLRQALHEAHAKARNEKRFPSESEIKDMHVPYLDAVIEETLRCAGVVSIVARTAICDTEISGYRIPKGTDIMVLLTGPSFNEPAVAVSGKSKISDNAVDHEPHKPSTFAWNYKDVREYRPERWLKNVAPGQKVQIFNANSGPNMPFSRGERQCLGKKQAMIQLRMAMSLLIWNFTFHRLATQFSGNARMEGMVNTPRDCFVRLSRR